MNELTYSKRSIKISHAMVGLFALLMFLCDIFGVPVVNLLTDYFLVADHGAVGKTVLLILLYTGSVPAYILLWNMHKLLSRLGKGEVFIKENVTVLGRISWCCLLAALLSLVGLYYYFSFIFVILASGFMGLIIRIIKNIIDQTILMKDELDLTI